MTREFWVSILLIVVAIVAAISFIIFGINILRKAQNIKLVIIGWVLIIAGIVIASALYALFFVFQHWGPH